MIEVYLLFCKQRLLVFFPGLFNHIKTSIHLTICWFHLFQSLNRIYFESPCSSFKTCAIQIVPNSQTNLQHIMKPLIIEDAFEPLYHFLHFLLHFIYLMFIWIEYYRLYSMAILWDFDQLCNEFLWLTQLLSITLIHFDYLLFIISWKYFRNWV